jgi:putative phosphoesterase
MSSSANPSKCKLDASYCKFGAETLLSLLDAFESQISGVVKSDDIEYVHKMRVASRRIRATLPLFKFCYPRKKYRTWLREIKKVTRLLAEARDLDVQTAYIQQYTAKLESGPEKSSLMLLLARNNRRRASIQPSVVNGLDELRASKALPDLSNFCKSLISESSGSAFDASMVAEKAHLHISQRIADFTAMEPYVYLENETLNHHKMRIFAKKLRYTLESFAPLFENNLSAEIKMMKAFQDVLGEMHDRDVWADYIQKFTAEAKPPRKAKRQTASSAGGRALLNFLNYIKKERKEYYSQLVQLWEENKKTDFFGHLQKTTSTGFSTAEDKLKCALADPTVKVAVLADIHANLHALKRVIEDAEKRGATVFLNAGDSVGFGPLPNQVINLLNEKNVLSILGNYDLEVIQGGTKDKGQKKLALEFTQKELTRPCESYLSALPRELRLEVAGKKLLVVHGSPESIDEHIYPDTPVERLKTLSDQAHADVVVVGHSHEQFMRDVNRVCFVNPGSVGRPSDGHPQTAYALLSFSPFKVRLIRLEYDVADAADALRKKALPESFAQMLLRGVALDAIIQEDRANKDAQLKECRKTVAASKKISATYWQDTAHYLQVAKLALAFFDGLSSLHQLGKRERCWLECAAVLHDVGLSKGASRHHKQSAKLILNDTRLPFTSEERRIIACIARYHRKGLPKQNQYLLAALNRAAVRKVEVLASLLRVADGLDYTHQAVVKSLTIKAGAKRITAECTCGAEAALEEQAFNKKKDLFEKVFKKKLVLTWTQQ